MYIKNLKIKETEFTERLGNRLWILTHSFHFEVLEQKYKIKRGFITDGASCPRILWNLCAPVAGPFGQGAIIHDYLYNEGPDLTKFIADSILYTAGRQRGADWLRSNLVYYGVRYFGGSSYKKGKSIDKVTIKSCYDYKQAIEKIKKIRGDNYE